MAHDSTAHDPSTHDPTAHDELTVAVLGPGGVGGLLAALLARAGHRVICLAGDSTADALRTTGIFQRPPPSPAPTAR